MKYSLTMSAGWWLILQGTITYAQTNEKVMDNQDNHSVEIIRYTIPDDQFESFEQAYQKAGAHLKDSPFCRGYSVIHGDDEPNHYLVTIYWTSKEDHLNGFRKSPQFSDFLELVKPFYNDINEMKRYTQTAIRWNNNG